MSSPTAALFPGQGSHAEGMDEPYRGNPLLERGFELLGEDPFARLTEGTRFQQPAILLCSLAAWEEADDRDDVIAAAGHSLGEYAALVAAGALAFDDAVRVVAERARAMDDAGRTQPGAMAAVLGGDDASVRELARELALTIANDNAPGQLVLSGPTDKIEVACAQARDRTGGRARQLPVSGAFHSPLMQPAAAKLEEALTTVTFDAPAFPVFSNGSAAPFTDPRSELVENLLAPVRWRETLLALRSAGATRFAEHGPGAILTGLVKRTLAVAGRRGAAEPAMTAARGASHGEREAE